MNNILNLYIFFFFKEAHRIFFYDDEKEFKALKKTSWIV